MLPARLCPTIEGTGTEREATKSKFRGRLDSGSAGLEVGLMPTRLLCVHPSGNSATSAVPGRHRPDSQDCIVVSSQISFDSS